MSSFVFNTSFHISSLHFTEWDKWLTLEMVPAVKLLFPGLIHEVFEVVTVNSSITRVLLVQWHCPRESLVIELDNEISILLKCLSERYGENITHFSTILKKL